MTLIKKQLLRMLSLISIIEGVSMSLPMIVALKYEETRVFFSTMMIAAISVGIGLLIRGFVKPQPLKFKSRDAFLYLILSMFTAVFVASLPYFFSGEGYNYIDCWFEAASGWTTTNAYVIPSDDIPLSLAMWKSETCWMGGLVIIFLTISLFQKLGIGGQKSMSYEISGSEGEPVTQRLSQSLRMAVEIYGILTILEFLMLLPSGNDPYFALLDTFSTVSTSGMVDVSAGGMSRVLTPYTEFVFTVFSFLSSINFIVYFMLLRGKPKAAFRNLEVRIYIVIILVSGLLVSMILAWQDPQHSVLASFGNGFMITVSFASTSGFKTEIIGAWPSFVKTLLMFLCLIGGCGFSTSSGIKVQRLVVLFFIVSRGFLKRIHPHMVKPIVIRNRTVSAERAASITSYTLLFFAFYILSTVLLSLDDLGLETTLAAPWAAITNTGMGFGAINTGFFGIFSHYGRLLLSFVMIAGRLDIYAFMVLFSRSFWDANRVTD